MDEDIFGSLSTKRKTSKPAQPLSTTLPSKSSLAASKPAGSKTKGSFNIDDIMGDDGMDFDAIPASKCIYFSNRLPKFLSLEEIVVL